MTLNEPESTFQLIAIGASAGGLEALQTFFNHVPDECIHSFVVIQHLSSDYKSLMADLLTKNTRLPIKEVKNNMKIESGTIYLIPSHKNITLEKNKFKLSIKPGRNQLNLPINLFFVSLAQVKKEWAIGIILSGTGSDGTIGIRAIKESGGIVFAQDPKQAQFEGMPHNAISTGLVDYVLRAEKIPQELFDVINNPRIDKMLEREIENDKATLEHIIDYIFEITKLDFRSYKRLTIVRRLARRMGINRCTSLRGYYDLLLRSKDEVHLVYHDFLIGVTRFFRDFEAWESLKNDVIPELVSKKIAKKEPLRIWCVACSTGEEAYTIAILINEEIEKHGKHLEVKIFATDLETTYLDKASKGIYAENIVGDLTSERLNKYFINKGNSYQVSNSLRNMIIFSRHNVINEPPFNKVDLVSCRNFLIYIKLNTQRKILNTLHFALNHEGHLILGSSETLGDLKNSFEEIDRRNRIFKNIDRRKTLGIESFKINTLYHPPSTKIVEKNGSETLMSKVLNSLLGEELGIGTIYINSAFNIIHGTGDYGKYLKLPEKEFSTNLIKMLPDELSITLHSAIRMAANEPNNNVSKRVKLKKGNIQYDLKLLVKCFKINPLTNELCYCIVFICKNKTTIEDEKVSSQSWGEKNQQILELEQELNVKNDLLQTTLEEARIANEEYQATNEELIAANEELQSTNEELQSTNEELYTVNAELEQKVEDIATINMVMDNLFKSTQISTIFLDSNLKIKKFSPSIVDQYNLMENDLDRPIEHFKSTFGETNDKALIEESLKVIKTNIPNFREIQTIRGKWFLRQISPFVSSDNKTEGVVVNFVDIDEQKELQSKYISQNQAFEQVLESTLAGYWDWMIQENTEYMSPTFKAMFGFEDHEVPNTPDWWQKQIHQDDLPKVLDIFNKHVKSKGKVPYSNEVRYHHKNGSIVWVYCCGKVIDWDEQGNPIRMVGSHVDITPHKEALEELQKREKQLKESKRLYEFYYENSDEMFASIKIPDGTINNCNKILCEKLGFKKDELIGKKLFDLVDKEISGHPQRYLKEFIKAGQIKSMESQLITKNGGKLKILVNAKGARNEEGKILYSHCKLTDLSDKNRFFLLHNNIN